MGYGVIWSNAAGLAGGSFPSNFQAAGSQAFNISSADARIPTQVGQDQKPGIQGASGNRTLAADQGSYAETGQTTNLLWKRILAASQGTYNETGQTTLFAHGYVITAIQGTYNETGQTTNLLRNRLIAASQGTYNETGQTTNLLRNRLVTVVSGTYNWTGQTTLLERGRFITAAQGTYNETGQTTTFTYVQTPFVQLHPDQTGKKVQAALNASMYAQYVAVIDSTGFGNAFVQVGTGAGKKMRTFENTIGGNVVEALAVTPVDSSGNPIL